MREIKFRVWDDNNEDMDYWGLQDRDYYACDGEERYHIMQYTGLKDKNGKEIYEGDVLADIYVVEWDEGGMKYILTYTQDGHYCMELNELTWEDTVVIGNIYENPDLVKK